MVVHINGYEIAVEEIDGNRFVYRLRRRGDTQWPIAGLTISGETPFDQVYDTLVAMVANASEEK